MHLNNFSSAYKYNNIKNIISAGKIVLNLVQFLRCADIIDIDIPNIINKYLKYIYFITNNYIPNSTNL